uniref:terminase large subunit domain-containing protein n=1 Tax=Roseiarcus sp. TaxID=1969460 RepID=UPI003F9B1818
MTGRFHTQPKYSLAAFTSYMIKGYQPSAVHYFIAAQLERVERGEIDRLILQVCPRHGKTTLAAHSFPAWCLGRRPDRQFIAASASADLARDTGREVRNIIDNPDYKLMFPSVSLTEDARAAGQWKTSQGGSWYSIGVGGDILGRGADIVLIDDPFGSMADAMSETIRDAVWRWYNGTIYNRLNSGGAIVIVGHRMHEDDLQGRLIERMK